MKPIHWFAIPPAVRRHARAVLLIGLLAGLASALPAAVVGPITVKGHGEFHNSETLIVDGHILELQTAYNDDACVYWESKDFYFILDLGRSYRIESLLVQVDNNDDYRIDASADGESFTPLVAIRYDMGRDIPGMDTFSTDPGSTDHVAGLEFQPRTARYLKICATDGDDAYAVSEIRVEGEPAVVRVPRPGGLAGRPGGAWPTTATGEYRNDLALISDGAFVEKGTLWDGDGCVAWTSADTRILVDLGKLQLIQAITVEVDNNDDYRLEGSQDGKLFFTLLKIKSAYGKADEGMDILSTDPQSPDYVAEFKYHPKIARYLRLQAIEGDNMYAVAELQLKLAPPPKTGKTGE